MSKKFLYRYTDILPLVHLLTNKQLTLLDPRSWDDKNDTHFINLYRKNSRLKTVLALCFARSEETYHHWKVFSSGPSGVRIQFNEDELKSQVANVNGIKFKDVNYFSINELRSKNISNEQLPFIKRAPYRPEREFRLLWESSSEEISAIPVRIKLSAIKCVTLSPWMHENLVANTKELLKSIPGCSELEVYKSTLVSNKFWKDLGDSAT